VVAVAEAPELTPLPAAGRPEVLGLVAHRGRALPLFDLGRCLNGSPRTEDRGPLCVVVGHGERRAAFLVDGLEGLARAPGPELPPGCETFDPTEVILGGAPGEVP
jgi:chemotaxis signal transduction protein